MSVSVTVLQAGRLRIWAPSPSVPFSRLGTAITMQRTGHDDKDEDTAGAQPMLVYAAQAPGESILGSSWVAKRGWTLFRDVSSPIFPSSHSSRFSVGEVVVSSSSIRLQCGGHFSWGKMGHRIMRGDFHPLCPSFFSLFSAHNSPSPIYPISSRVSQCFPAFPRVSRLQW